MKILSNTETVLKKNVAYKKACIFANEESEPGFRDQFFLNRKISIACYCSEL